MATVAFVVVGLLTVLTAGSAKSEELFQQLKQQIAKLERQHSQMIQVLGLFLQYQQELQTSLANSVGKLRFIHTEYGAVQRVRRRAMHCDAARRRMAPQGSATQCTRSGTKETHNTFCDLYRLIPTSVAFSNICNVLLLRNLHVHIFPQV